jgi:hypothetical protein
MKCLSVRIGNFLSIRAHRLQKKKKGISTNFQKLKQKSSNFKLKFLLKSNEQSSHDTMEDTKIHWYSSSPSMLDLMVGRWYNSDLNPQFLQEKY